MLNIHTDLLKRVDANQFWLLSHIAKRIGRTDHCWPSNKTLCKDTGWGLKKLQEVKKNLLDSGFIQVFERRSEEGRTSNGYRIMTDLVSVYVPASNFAFVDCDTPPTPKTGIGGHIPFSTTPPTPKTGIEVLSSEVLVNMAKGEKLEELTYQKPLFTEEVIPRTKKEKVKKEKPSVDLAFSICKEIWINKFPTMKMGWDGRQAKALKDLMMIMELDCKERSLSGTPDEIKEMFEWFISNLPPFYHGQEISVIKNKIGNITHLMKHGQPTGKKQSAFDYINNL